MPTRYSQDDPFRREREALGAQIAKVRKSKNLTQEDLADKAHINVSYLAKIENGYVNTTVRYLIKLSRGLGVKLSELFPF